MKTSKLIGILSILTITIVIVVAIAYARNSPLRIDVEDARRQISKGEVDVILDVRTDAEWALGHAPGAIHISVNNLKSQAPDLISKKARIIIYCNTGQRARVAAEILQSLGFSNVKYITSSHLSLSA